MVERTHTQEKYRQGEVRQRSSQKIWRSTYTTDSLEYQAELETVQITQRSNVVHSSRVIQLTYGSVLLTSTPFGFHSWVVLLT